jgi:hypothetical protein
MTIPSIPASGASADRAGIFRSAYPWLACSAGALGGLLFGYDWVVIGGAKPFGEIYFYLDSPSIEGWAMSCALIGCLAGLLFLYFRLPETKSHRPSPVCVPETNGAIQTYT